MKKLLMIAAFAFFANSVFAQDGSGDSTVKKGFKPEKLFTGGSVALSFFNSTFLVGGNPVFGYSLTNWLDAGLVFNINYVRQKNYYYVGDRVKQTTLGGGVFTRVYPVRFLFLQGQLEQNNTSVKYFPPNNANATEKYKIGASSFLVGGGYTSGRQPGNMYFYMAILFDVTKNEGSPYLDNEGNATPVIRAGVHIPLFQHRNDRD